MINFDTPHFFKLFTRAYPGLMSYINPDYSYGFVSDKYFDWFDLTPEEVVGKHLGDIIGEKAFQARKAYIDHALKGEQVTFQSTLIHHTLGLRDTEQIYYPDKDESGSVRGIFALAHDVTERLENEKRIKEADARTRKLVDEEKEKLYSLLMQSPAMITVLTGEDLVIEFQNTRSATYTGRSLVGKSVREALPELEQQGYIKMLEGILKDGKSVTINAAPLSLKQTDGSTKFGYVDLFYEPMRDESGKVTGIFNLAIDVTEQVTARLRAEESQKLFRSYAESMPQMAFIANPAGEIIFFNKRWEDYTGSNPYTTSESNLFLHPEDYPKVMKTWEKAVETGELYQIEERLLRKDGTYRWHLGRAIPIRNSGGEITKWMGTVTDIHEYKEIESYQARLIQVMESSADFVGMVSLEGTVLYVNEVARSMVGISRDKPLSSIQRQDFFFEEDISLLKNIIIPTALEKGSWSGEVRLRHFQTQEAIWVHYNTFVTKDEKTGEMTGFAAIARDLTEIKKRERDLENALRTRDEFLSIASHELKTPLTSLKLQAQLFLRSLKKGDPLAVTQERLENMASQSNELVSRLSRLIDDMLDVSRIRTGRLNLDKSAEDLYEITRSVVQRMEMQFQAAGLDTPTIRGTDQVIGEWDRYRIEQVLGNLLTNAIRYGQGKPIDIDVRKEKDRAILRVRDHGYGISKEDQERIFDRFERAINASEVSGMGLGLFITREIVRTHQGEISVESEPGQGATFVVDLPLRT